MGVGYQFSFVNFFLDKRNADSMASKTTAAHLHFFLSCAESRCLSVVGFVRSCTMTVAWSMGTFASCSFLICGGRCHEQMFAARNMICFSLTYEKLNDTLI